MKPRQLRQKVLIRARLKATDGWHDACIVDLSRRGAGLQVAIAPTRGTYVEIRRGMHVIVGRVVWSRGHRLGVAAQDDIPVDLVAADRAPANRHGKTPANADRRRLPRGVSEPGESSRNWGRRLQFGVAILCGMATAMVAGGEVRLALAQPLGQIGAALDR